MEPQTSSFLSFSHLILCPLLGWTEALQLMQVGDKWELYIPSDLAYGPNGPPSIGSNQVLIFEGNIIDGMQTVILPPSLHFQVLASSYTITLQTVELLDVVGKKPKAQKAKKTKKAMDEL